MSGWLQNCRRHLPLAVHGKDQLYSISSHCTMTSHVLHHSNQDNESKFESSIFSYALICEAKAIDSKASIHVQMSQKQLV